MSRSHAGRILTALILAAIIAASSAWGVSPGSAPAGPPDLFARLWGAFTAIWAEVGCIIDPHGDCAQGQSEAPAPPPTTDAGCIADPHGGCVPDS